MSLPAAERVSVFPSTAKPLGPYSPGILTGEFLYVSGQGAPDSSGLVPNDVQGQTANCLKNIQAIVEAAGLTMDHIVYTHTYLSDIRSYAAMNEAYAKFFPRELPARSTMGVARMPQDTPVEISAIAIRDLKNKQTILLQGTKTPVPISPGVLTRDRFFISGILGRDAERNVTPEQPEAQLDVVLARLKNVLGAADLAPEHLVHLNVYRTAGMPQAMVEKALQEFAPDTAISLVDVTSLPFDVKIGITGVAVRDAAQKKTHRSGGKILCASAGDTVYCAARASADVSATLQEMGEALKAMGTDLSRAVANNVYIDDMDRFAAMNAAYAKAFPSPPPTRTTVQPVRSASTTRIAVIALR